MESILDLLACLLPKIPEITGDLVFFFFCNIFFFTSFPSSCPASNSSLLFIFFSLMWFRKGQELIKVKVKKSSFKVATSCPIYSVAEVYPLKRPKGMSTGDSIIALYLQDRFGIFI